MEGATEKAIEKYCEHIQGKFIGYSGGWFTFKNIFGEYESMTQTDLIKKVRKL